jgi:succinate dehydrogenase / fumarate reductase membrane anchor subunit
VRDQGLWTWHLAAGVVILLLLGLHMTIMHLDGIVRVFSPAAGQPIAWANVTARGKSVFFLVNYVLLLGAALFHGLYGLRNILFELNPATGVKKGLNALFFVGGLALFVFGSWAAWAGFTVSRGA